MKQSKRDASSSTSSDPNACRGLSNTLSRPLETAPHTHCPAWHGRLRPRIPNVHENRPKGGESRDTPAGDDPGMDLVAWKPARRRPPCAPPATVPLRGPPHALSQANQSVGAESKMEEGSYFPRGCPARQCPQGAVTHVAGRIKHNGDSWLCVWALGQHSLPCRLPGRAWSRGLWL